MIAWHYTTGQKFVKILESGYLMPTAIGIEPPEKPVLWFSTNQKWELTANKATYDANGNIKRLTMEETFKLGGGLVRFGVELNKLHLGIELKNKARISSSVWNALFKEGLMQKAKPSEWCGTVKSIPVDKLIIDVMSEDFTWERVTG